MANPIIKVKRTDTVGKIPTESDLAPGQIGYNIADRKIYARHDDPLGGVVQIAASPIHTHQIADINGLQAALDAASGGVSTINDLDEMFNSARATYYHEINYNAGGDVSAIEVYATSAKTTHLYSRAFTYNASGNITQVLTTDRQNSGVSLTKTISYNGSGDIATVTRSYSL